MADVIGITANLGTRETAESFMGAIETALDCLPLREAPTLALSVARDDLEGLRLVLERAIEDSAHEGLTAALGARGA